MSDSVIVYNLGGQEVLGRVSVQKAIKNLIKGTYRIIEKVEGAHFGPFDLPRAVELTKFLYAKWKYSRKGEVPFSKIGVLRRDNFTCSYCGVKGDRSTMTLDHILPKWQGNSASWTNSATACQPCNNKKGGRSPKEAGMKLLITPRIPSFHEAYSWTHDK